MIATVNATDLKRALTALNRAVSKRNTLPVLSNVHASYTDDGRLSLYATDLDIGIRVVLDTLDVGRATDTEPVTFSCADALSFAKSAPKVASIVSDGDRVRLESTGSTITLDAIDAEEFPSIPFDGAYDGTVDGRTFARACKRAYVTAAKDETRPILTGAYMRSLPVGLVMVTADNYRISESVVPWALAPSDDAPSVVVPARALKVWAMIAAKVDTVRFDVRPNSGQWRMTADDITMVSRIIDGQFPNYEQVLPTAHGTVASFAVKPAASAVSAVKGAAKDRASNVVRLALNGRLDLSVVASGETVAESSAPIVKSGDDMTIALNVEYLADALASLGAEASAYFNGPLSPVMIHSRDTGDDYRVCVMPVRVPA